ncbi:sodium channel protein Nach-like [Achroia grisella]|uniref:sodium channel protein Nach-like n=1 Tax=Achroia grisella TaxID=688607 RepID=UPI0027D27370|nr:sodium channel protein Nach-like [Achroia grisella]
MRPSIPRRVIKRYLDTTTLHGFKYLRSQYYQDRIGWILACFAGAVCAGFLCATFWDRFRHHSTVMVLEDRRFDMGADDGHISSTGMPQLIAVCHAPEAVAGAFVRQLLMFSKQVDNTTRLSGTISNILWNKPVEAEQLILLDQTLERNEIRLVDGLLNYTSECSDVLIVCRWQHHYVPCELLFVKQLTRWGVCCVMDEYRLHNQTTNRLLDDMENTRMLDLVMNHSRIESPLHGYAMITKYSGEGGVEPMYIQRGYAYQVQLMFTLLLDGVADADNIVAGNCVSDNSYSRDECELKCLENKCGCSDPRLERTLPPCPLTKTDCFAPPINGNTSCQCPFLCEEYVTDLSLEGSPIKTLDNSIDPIHRGLNITTSIVVHFQVKLRDCKVISQIPTETWLTLMSALGGVFNMFLGVGLFSALELLYIILLNIPNIIRSCCKINKVLVH